MKVQRKFEKQMRFSIRKVLPVFFALFSFSSIPASAQTSSATLDGNIHLGSVDSQSIGLGAKLEVTVDVSADEAQTVNFSIDSEDLAEQIQNSDISIQANPPQISLAAGETKEVKIEIQTKSSAPSFDAKKFGFVVKSDKGSLLTSTDISLKVIPLYVVTVTDGPDADNAFEFDSPPGISYFREHAKGLQFIFKNLSSKPIIIHGSGVIKHQGFTPLQHGDVYQPPLVLPSAGADAPGYYTIHEVYHPDRSVIVNTTKFGAAAPAADAPTSGQ
jgi:hypothetical protein